MTNNKNKMKKGFTIIEVVLVLAIAGLIFLMVFIALPALQRSQKDSQRQNDYSLLSSAITSYSSSNGGRLYKLANASSATASGTKTYDAIAAARYINKNGDRGTGSGIDEDKRYYAADPDGREYKLIVETFDKFNSATLPTTTSTGGSYNGGRGETTVYVVLTADCSGTNTNGGNMPAKVSSSRSFAVYGYVEGGSGTYCLASQ